MSRQKLSLFLLIFPISLFIVIRIYSLILGISIDFSGDYSEVLGWGEYSKGIFAWVKAIIAGIWSIIVWIFIGYLDNRLSKKALSEKKKNPST